MPFGPHRIERLPKTERSRKLAVRLGDRFERVVCAVQLVELGRSHWEKGATLEDLQLDPELEHVGRRRHHHVRLTGLGEQRAHRVAAAGLDAGLIDGAGHHVGRTECECGGGGGRRADTPGGADSQPGVETMLGLEAILQLEHRR